MRDLANNHSQNPPKIRKKKLKKPYQIRRPRRSIKADRVHPSDFIKFIEPVDANGRPLGGFFCEACSHYDSITEKCTLGYRAQHKREDQVKVYALTGRVVLCRAIEID